MRHPRDDSASGEAVTIQLPTGDLSVTSPDLQFDARYRFEQLLGEGGMGRVALCRDQQIGRRVAMKLLHPRLREVPDGVGRFLREARIQGQLEHPAIVPVYDLGLATSGDAYFTMQQVRGPTLEEVLHEPGRAPTGMGKRGLLAAFGRVCLAVHYAHEHGVLHRDLKPENIMLGHFGEVFVLDWGIARCRDEPSWRPAASLDVTRRLDGTDPGELMGTPGYMSPEQVLGDPDLMGPASDCYALGTILFEVLTHRPLHDGAKLQAILASTVVDVSDRVTETCRVAGAPPELTALCIEALALDPRERLSDAREMHRRVEAYLDGERDESRRRLLAQQHAEEAASLASVSRDLEGRRDAMREVGRALALDPGHPRALGVLIELLREPLVEVPEEVTAAGEHARQERLVAVGRAARWVYLGMLTLLPLAMVMGVASYARIMPFFVAMLVAGGLTQWVVRRPSDLLLRMAFVVTVLGCSFTAYVYGAMILMPAAVATNAILYAMVVPKRERRWVYLGCAVAIAVPFGLEFAGVTHAYADTAEGITIVAPALGSGVTAMLLLGFLSTLLPVMAAIFGICIFRDALARAEREVVLRDWHLRQMVGGEPPSSRRFSLRTTRDS